MTLLTKYITADDFFDYFGIDLNAQLPGDDNPSNKADRFIKRIEDRVEAFLNAVFYRDIEKEYPEFTDYQKKHYKLALLEQAIYVFQNGDISVDSGFNYDQGETASNDTILKKSIAPNAKNELMLCGLWCRRIKGHRGGWTGLWL